MKFSVLFFVRKQILFLQKKDKKNNIKKNIKGPELLKNKKKCLMVKSWIEKNLLVYTYPTNEIFSKFVSIQNQIDKIKNILIQLINFFLKKVCIFFQIKKIKLFQFQEQYCYYPL